MNDIYELRANLVQILNRRIILRYSCISYNTIIVIAFNRVNIKECFTSFRTLNITLYYSDHSLNFDIKFPRLYLSQYFHAEGIS